MNGRTPQVEVVLEDGTPPDHQEAISRHLDNHGISATVSTTDPENLEHGIASGRTRFDPGVEGAYSNGHRWSMRIHGLVNEVVSSAGASSLRDAIDGLRRLRSEQTGSSPSDGVIMLVDEDTGVRVDLKFQLPLSAYEGLARLRFSTFEADPISYHHKSGRNGRWRSPH